LESRRITDHLIDHGYNAHKGEHVTWFGFFECIDDGAVARALLDQVREQARRWGDLVSVLNQRARLAPDAETASALTREAEGRRVPVVLFTKGAGLRLETMADSGADALGVDWTVDLADARRLTGDRVALQGNLDPATLYANPAAIEIEARRVLESYGDGPGHVFNLGHGISPDVNPEHLGALVKAVHRISRELRS